MLKEQLSLLYPVLAILLALTVLVLYVYYTSPRQYRIKLLLGPALLAASIFAVPSVGARLGYGWPAPLPPSFQYLAHMTVVAGSEKRWIDVLLVARPAANGQPRLHRIRWSGEVEKVLEQAREMQADPHGGDVVVNGPAAIAPGGAGQPGYSTLRVLPQDRTRKGPPAPRPPAAPREEDQRRPPGSLRYET